MLIKGCKLELVDEDLVTVVSVKKNIRRCRQSTYPAPEANVDLGVESLDFLLLVSNRANPGRYATIIDCSLVKLLVKGFRVQPKSAERVGRFTSSTEFEILQVVESSKGLGKIDSFDIGCEATTYERIDEAGR